MLTNQALRFTSSLLAISLVAAPAAAQAQAPQQTAQASPQSMAADVSLRADGLLIGQFMTAQGAPVVGAEVVLTNSQGQQAMTRTNQDGAFAFSGVKGLSQISGPQAQQLVRAWAEGSAPPNAAPALLLVQQQDVARGQYPAGVGAQNFFDHSKRLMANPLFVAGAIGTAVAVPVAIANADDDDPAS